MRMLCKPLYALQAVTEAGGAILEGLGKGSCVALEVWDSLTRLLNTGLGLRV